MAPCRFSHPIVFVLVVSCVSQVFHMQWLHAQGLQPDKVVDTPQHIDDTVVVTEDSLTAYLLGESDRNNVDLIDDVDAVHVVEAHLAYFEAIGAVGPQAPLDDVI